MLLSFAKQFLVVVTVSHFTQHFYVFGAEGLASWIFGSNLLTGSYRDGISVPQDKLDYGFVLFCFSNNICWPEKKVI